MPCPKALSKTPLRALTLMTPVVIAAAAIADAGRLEAQTAGWVPVGYSSAPSARTASGIVYDAATHATVLFGGADGNSVYGDTWTWDRTWQPMFPATSPSPRQGPAIAFDGAAGNVVLFGGSPTVPVGSGTAFGDTWTWDGSNWTQQFPPVSPPARTWTNMVYVPGTRTVLLFGGTNTPDGDDAFDDTWAWDGIARTWTRLNPAAHPSARLINQLVYDGATRTVLLFGGVTANLTDLNDTWTWDGANWTPHFPASNPGPRNGPSLAYDAALRAVLLFGGAVGACCSNSLNDTWAWDGANWTEIYPANTPPRARNAANMDYNPLYQVVLLFGGDSSGPVLDDTWLLAP
jgi:hypothetical protein